MKKQICAILLAAAMLLGVLASCAGEGRGSGGEDTRGPEETDPTGGEEEDDDIKERKLRVLDPDLTYETEDSIHKVSYTDSAGRAVTIFGRLTAPDGEGRFPAVILSHGFNGHYTDFAAECLRWAGRGYVCYAFDFCGAQAGGLSTGRTAGEYTPYTMVEDLKAVLEDIRALENVDPTQVFLFGGSQGGFVTALTAAEMRDEVAAVAMYFPAFNIPDDWRSAPIQDTPLMGYSIGAEFIRSIRELDPFEVIGAFDKDVCIVWGDRDALVARRYIDGAVAAYGQDRVDLTVIPGAGHGFGGAALQEAVEKVLSFLEAHTYEVEP